MTLRPAREAALWAALVFILLQLSVHWHPELRSGFDFRPASARGDLNDDMNVWMAGFSARLRELPFRDTLYLVNPFGHFAGRQGTRVYALYSSHPGLLTLLLGGMDQLLGASAFLVRTLGMAFFALRVFFLFSLGARLFGTPAARLAVALYLLIPATHHYTHALLFESVSGTLALGAFWALAFSPGLAVALGILACGLEWSTAVVLPFLALGLRRARPAAALVAGALVLMAFELWWTASFPSAASNATYLATRLKGYFSWMWEGLTPMSAAAAAAALRESFPWFVMAPFAFACWKLRAALLRPELAGLGAAGALLLLLFFPAFAVHPYVSQLLAPALVLPAAWAWDQLRARKLAAFAPAALVTLALALPAIRAPWSSAAEAAAIGKLRSEAEAVARIVGDGSVYLPPRPPLTPDPLGLYLLPATLHPAPEAMLEQEYCVGFALLPTSELTAYGYSGPPAELEDLLRKRPECREPVYTGSFLRLLSGRCLCRGPALAREKPYRLPRGL